MAAIEMDLHGQALLDYLHGDIESVILLHRDDGFTYDPIPAKHWFYEAGLPELDQHALARCVGRVLDVGAAAGSHALVLQAQGFDVVAVDRSPKAVEAMQRREVRQARIGDLFDTYATRFDTILVIGNIGIVGDLAGLDRFFQHLDSVLTEDGQVITDSIDPRNPTDERYQVYTAHKQAQGRYVGERTLRFEYKEQLSGWFEWMHIDPETLEQHARKAGLRVEHVANDGRRYLVVIKRG